MSASDTIIMALLLPLAGVVGILLASRISDNLREAVTLITALGTAFTVWSLIPYEMRGERPTLTLFEIVPGIDIAFAVEPLGMLFGALASGLWIINSIYSIGYMRGNGESNQTRFYVFFAVSISATLGIAFAGNLFTLFVFYEMLTLATYPLVSHKGDKKTVRSARIYLGVLLTTSIGLFLPAIIWTYVSVGHGDFVYGGIIDGHIEGAAIGLLLVLFVFGVGKAAVMPVHRWLPAAMVAPTPVSALLHAVAVVKAGVFTITKVIIYIFGIDLLAATPSTDWLLYAAAFTVLAASIVALRQQNLKRLLAYSTVAQLSYVVLAVSILTPAAEIGATLHIVAHAFGKITLFFAAGAIYVASKKTEIPQLAGIGKLMPWTMTAFTIGALSMIGVPPTGGFVSKWYMLAGALQSDNYVALITIVLSTVLNAAYFLPIIYAVWFMPVVNLDKKTHGEAPWPMVLALTLTASLAVAFFLFNASAIELESQIFGGWR